MRLGVVGSSNCSSCRAFLHALLLMPLMSPLDTISTLHL